MKIRLHIQVLSRVCNNEVIDYVSGYSGTIFSSVQFHDHFTDGSTPWMGYQLDARPLPKHRITQTE
jgi:hypothetical protein